MLLSGSTLPSRRAAATTTSWLPACAEAALSFLGVGVQPPDPSLGLMIAQSQSSFSTAPHLLIFPGMAIIITVLGFLLVGDGLRDALDVKDT